MGAGSSVQKGKGGDSPARPWVTICFASSETKLAKRIVEGLQEGGLLVKGHQRPADGSGKRLHDITAAGAFLGILSKGFAKSKSCKAEFQHAQDTGLPIAVARVGVWDSNTEWLDGASNEHTSLDFTDPSLFESNMALLMLQLKPHHVSDFAREMSTMGAVLPKMREAEALRQLEQSMSDPKVCRATLRELLGLSLQARGCDQLIQGNLVPLVAATVEANPTSPDVALYACWILSHLVYCTPDLDLRNRVDSEGGTEMVVKVMKAHASNAPIQMHGCTALQLLAVSDTIVGCGALEAVYKVVAMHAKNASAQLQAIRLLHAMATSESIKPQSMRKVRGAKSLKSCKTVMSRYPEGTQCHAAAALCKKALS